jgi:HEAT repeat protein
MQETRSIDRLKSENPVLKKQAVIYLGQHRCAEAVPPLLELLNSEQPRDLLLAVINALGAIGGQPAADQLIPVLSDKDLDVRPAAIVALARMRSRNAVSPLAELARSGEPRLPAIWALGQIGDPAAVPVLKELLKNPDKDVSYNAMQSLKKLAQ